MDERISDDGLAEPIDAGELRRRIGGDAAPDAAPAEARTGERSAPGKAAEPAADAPAAAPAPQPARSEPARSRGLTRPLLFALLPVAIVVGGYFYVTGGAVVSTENAYVQADMVRLSTDVSGIVGEIDVRDNQKVAAGDVLFRLDDRQFQLALERADAQIGLVRNDLNALKASYRTMQAQIAQARQDVSYYETAFKRQQQLASKSYSPQATYDSAEHDLQNAQQKLQQLQDQLAGIAANLNGDPDAPVEQHPRYKDAVAARDEAARQLQHATVRAPFAGIVTNVPALQKGQYLEAGTAAFSVVSTDHVWIAASPKETELTYVEPGQNATVTVDAYPGVAWHGTVESISPASAASFSLLPAENTSGNWVKVVQRIPLRVRVETPADKPQLRVGMSVVLDMDTGHARGWPKL